MFPILWQGSLKYQKELQELGCPRHIPLELIRKHELQALINHDQNLAKLASRGGLSPAETVLVLTDRGIKDLILHPEQFRNKVIIPVLKIMIENYQRKI
jgi:hypothetical protein